MVIRSKSFGIRVSLSEWWLVASIGRWLESVDLFEIEDSSLRSSSSASSSSWNLYPDPHLGYGQGGYPYSYNAQQPSYQPYYDTRPPPPPQNYDHEPHNSGRVPRQDDKIKLERKYSRIADNYNSIYELTEALARAGLESPNLILGIDFTKSNECTGMHSFNRKSLHHNGNGPNTYEQAISIVGKTLAAFDEDNLIPCFGFGDASTHDQDVSNFYPDERFYGQVIRSIDTDQARLSPQEQKTMDAIVEASEFPLSIMLVGVGDGPWDMMKEFDDNMPARVFDNFQFVNFTEIMSTKFPPSRKEAAFSLATLMEIPSQCKAAKELDLLGSRKASAPQRVALPTPSYGSASFTTSKPYGSTSFGASKPSHATPSFEQSAPSFFVIKRTLQKHPENS
ncbi:unnamed protein product [Vicia faba]|uniref:Copine C-terminal domain-containing protein n=1 Tax=Vicia faba TaxID=3906 RepID=A0AAV0ZD61_VICFA|nr:unnamed protein product [Vicia faba]